MDVAWAPPRQRRLCGELGEAAVERPEVGAPAAVERVRGGPDLRAQRVRVAEGGRRVGGPAACLRAQSLLPLAFIVALLPTQWRGRRSLLPWTVAAAVGVGVAATVGPSWAMLIGGAAGTAVSALRGDDAGA